MAKPRLKVYRAQMGFADTVVAAPNQKAALQAWGARQNLFGEGLAAVTEEPAAVKAALAHPGEVLQRAAGAAGAFKPGAAAPPDLPPAPRRPKAKPAPSPQPPPKPDRAALDAAEAALRDLDAQAQSSRAEFERRRAALDQEEARRMRELAERRKAAGRKLQAERRAFRAAGGEPVE